MTPATSSRIRRGPASPVAEPTSAETVRQVVEALTQRQAGALASQLLEIVDETVQERVEEALARLPKAPGPEALARVVEQATHRLLESEGFRGAVRSLVPGPQEIDQWLDRRVTPLVASRASEQDLRGLARRLEQGEESLRAEVGLRLREQIAGAAFREAVGAHAGTVVAKAVQDLLSGEALRDAAQEAARAVAAQEQWVTAPEAERRVGAEIQRSLRAFVDSDTMRRTVYEALAAFVRDRQFATEPQVAALARSLLEGEPLGARVAAIVEKTAQSQRWMTHADASAQLQSALQEAVSQFARSDALRASLQEAFAAFRHEHRLAGMDRVEDLVRTALREFAASETLQQAVAPLVGGILSERRYVREDDLATRLVAQFPLFLDRLFSTPRFTEEVSDVAARRVAERMAAEPAVRPEQLAEEIERSLRDLLAGDRLRDAVRQVARAELDGAPFVDPERLDAILDEQFVPRLRRALDREKVWERVHETADRAARSVLDAATILDAADVRRIVEESFPEWMRRVVSHAAFQSRVEEIARVQVAAPLSEALQALRQETAERLAQIPGQILDAPALEARARGWARQEAEAVPRVAPIDLTRALEAFDERIAAARAADAAAVENRLVEQSGAQRQALGDVASRLESALAREIAVLRGRLEEIPASILEGSVLAEKVRAWAALAVESGPFVRPEGVQQAVQASSERLREEAVRSAQALRDRLDRLPGEILGADGLRERVTAWIEKALSERPAVAPVEQAQALRSLGETVRAERDRALADLRAQFESRLHAEMGGQALRERVVKLAAEVVAGSGLESAVHEARAQAQASSQKADAVQAHLLGRLERALAGPELQAQVRSLAEEVARARPAASPQDLQHLREEISRARLETVEGVPAAVRRELTTPDARRIVGEIAHSVGVGEAELDAALVSFLGSDKLAQRVRALAESAAADAVGRALQGHLPEQTEAALRRILPAEMKDLQGTLDGLVHEAVRREIDRPKFQERLLEDLRSRAVTDAKLDDALDRLLRSESLFERISTVAAASAERIAGDVQVAVQKQVRDLEARLQERVERGAEAQAALSDDDLRERLVHLLETDPLLARALAVRAREGASAPPAGGDEEGAGRPRPSTSISRRFQDRRRKT